METDQFEVIQLDLLDPENIRRMFEIARPEWVVHCAALTDVDLCEEQPRLAKKMNVEVPRWIANEARESRARLVHISTDAVFDGEKGDYLEEDTPHPPNQYGSTKLSGEQEVLKAYPQAIVARVNFFGWSPSGKRSLAEFFIQNIREGNNITGFTDVIFNPLLANDLGKVLLSVLEEGTSGIFHMASRGAMSKYQFGVEIAERFNENPRLITPGSVNDVDLKADRGCDLTLNVSKLQRTITHKIPKLSTELDRFFTLYQQGYPQKLQNMYHGKR